MRTFVAIPAQDQIKTKFAGCLTRLDFGADEVSINFSESSLVYDSRNQLSTSALNSDADLILWLDTDMTFSRDMYLKMKADLEKGADMVCGLFFARRPPYQPCIYKKIRQALDPKENISEKYEDYPENELFEIDACGMAACLVKANVLKEVISVNHDAFGPLRGYGEDISFCIRAKKLGYKLFCDSAIKVGHIGEFGVTEDVYKQYRELVK